jgi:thiamine biosynthesis protein ThiS
MPGTETDFIDIVVNGKPRRVPSNISVEQLLGHLEINPSRVAVERNLSIVRKPVWGETQVEPGDRFEIVWFVGGG